MNTLNLINEITKEENNSCNTKQTFTIESFLNKIRIINNKNLNILHVNIRSINKNFDNLLILLEQIKEINVDIILLTETWNVSNINYFNLEGYSNYYNDAHNNQNDGLVIFYKDSLLDFTVSNIKFSETSGVRIKLAFNKINYGITAIYRSPSTDTALFLTQLENYLNDIHKEKIEIIVGDINIDTLNLETNTSSSYLNILALHNYSRIITDPTRITSETKSCIDHINLRTKNNIKDLLVSGYVLQSDITDHLPILINFEFKNNKNNQTKETQKRKFKISIDYESFNKDLNEETWHNILDCEDVVRATNNFIDIYKMYLDRHTHTKKIKNSLQKIKPWISMAIIKSIRQRDALKIKLINQKNNIELKTQYRIYRNKLNKVIKAAKILHYKNKLNNNKTNNLKETYKIISEVSNEKNKESSNIKLVHNNVEITDNKEIASIMNEFFINIGQNLAKKIDYGPKITHKHLNESLFLNPVSSNEIIEHINSLKNNSSPGPDKITSLTIKNSHTYIIEPIKHIFNLIFNTGIIPGYFKESIVTPIYKEDKKNDVNNYRPISQINSFAKLLEHCLKNRLTHFLDKYNILSKNQFGFIKGSSTENAIHKLCTLVNTNLNNSKKCITVFLDLAKAFDTIPHSLLLEKLENIGIRGTALNVFKSYLTDRKQAVKIKDYISEKATIKTGCPQGTVISPILFLIFLNDLCNLSINGEIISYADDTCLIFEGDTWEQTLNTASNGLNIVYGWLNSHLLSLNIKKSTFLTFSITKADEPPLNRIYFNNQLNFIEKRNSVKYLGVMVDNHLKWNIHTEFISSKLRKLIHKFYLIRDIFTRDILKNIYTALVESVLRYGIRSWGGLYNSGLKVLQTMQNYIIKVAFKKEKQYSTDSLYRDTKLHDIRSLYIINSIIFIHKSNDIQFINHKHGTRKKINQEVIISKNNKQLCQRNGNYFAKKFYNSLPLEIRNLSNRKTYIKTVKTYVNNNISKFKNLID